MSESGGVDSSHPGQAEEFARRSKQLSCRPRFLRTGRGAPLPAAAVGGAEWLVAEARAAWLACAIFSSLEGTSRLSEGHPKGRRLLDWLCGRAEAPWTRARWSLGAAKARMAGCLGGGWLSCWDARRWEHRFSLGVPLVGYVCWLLFVLFPSQLGH